MDEATPLLYMSSVAGMIMIVGGIWLIAKQKIFIDRVTNQVTEIETPVGTFKTNVPALVLFALGFVPLIGPIYLAQHKPLALAREVIVKGHLANVRYPAYVYAVQSYDELRSDRDYQLRVVAPSSTNVTIKLLYVSGEIILDDIASAADERGGAIQMREKRFVDGDQRSLRHEDVTKADSTGASPQ